MRELAKTLLGEHPWMIPTIDERIAFEKHPTLENGPTAASFRLDLGRKILQNPWNKQAAEIFADEFIAREEFDCEDHDKIRTAFLVHLTTLQTHYRKYLADAGPIDGALEVTKRDERFKYAAKSRKYEVHIPLFCG